MAAIKIDAETAAKALGELKNLAPAEICICQFVKQNYEEIKVLRGR